MEIISSDTNIWIDFDVAKCLTEPFMLADRYTYIMSRDALRDEILSPPEMSARLIELGVVAVDISESEYLLANNYGEKYVQLSIYDRIALSIASTRKIKLLSGDKALRSAAVKEKVEVHGTIWLMDMLLETGKISECRYIEILREMQRLNGDKIRLPEKEIEKRLFEHGRKVCEKQ